MSIKGVLSEELPREKLIRNGPSSLTNIELLAILLRTGTKNKSVLELSREVLENFSVEIISSKTYDELNQFCGIKKAKATQIIAAFELARRLSYSNTNSVKFACAQDVYNYLRNEVSFLNKEVVQVLFVNSKNKLIKKEIVSEGGLNYSIINVRELIKKTLNLDASGLFLIHNHPSGDVKPSKEDIKVTLELKEICEKLEVRFLDHIIIGEGFFSFFEEDMI